MKRMLIYPFGKEAEPIVNHFKQLESIYPVCLVGLRGWDDGERKGYYAEGENIPLKYEFSEGYVQYNPDIIWFVDFRGELEFENFYLPYIRMAVADDKEIIASIKVRKKINEYLPNEKIRYYNTKIRDERNQEVGSYLQPINTPIIYVCGLYEGVGKFELQLMILELTI